MAMEELFSEFIGNLFFINLPLTGDNFTWSKSEDSALFSEFMVTSFLLI